MEEMTSNHRATRHPGRHQSERPADFDRNRWPTSIGMPGRHHRNPHLSGRRAHFPPVDKSGRSTANPLRPARHPHPSSEPERWPPRFDATSPNLTPRLYPRSPRCRQCLFPAISCLGAFPTPACELVTSLVIAGVRKPAHRRTLDHRRIPDTRSLGRDRTEKAARRARPRGRIRLSICHRSRVLTRPNAWTGRSCLQTLGGDFGVLGDLTTQLINAFGFNEHLRSVIDRKAPGFRRGDVIEMSFVVNPRQATTDPVGKLLIEIAAPCRTVSWLT
jgi:hypothetical protein